MSFTLEAQPMKAQSLTLLNLLRTEDCNGQIQTVSGRAELTGNGGNVVKRTRPDTQQVYPGVRKPSQLVKGEDLLEIDISKCDVEVVEGKPVRSYELPDCSRFDRSLMRPS